MHLSSISCAAVAAILLAAPAAAQERRADVLAAEQARKAADPPPHTPAPGERLVKAIENALYGTPDGFYPYLETVYSGGGFTGGAGYRRYVGDATYWDVKGLYSVKDYKLVELSTASLDLMNGRLALGARLGWRDASQVGYYGLGMESTRGERANFGFEQTWAGGEAAFLPTWWLRADATLAYEAYSETAGAGRHPSIETRYTDLTAPGLGRDPSFVHASVGAAIDTRPAADYARSGSKLGVSLHDYANRGADQSFSRLEVDAVQHVPVLRETWVISLHGNLDTTLDGDVPYFLMPSVGGGSSLRGYSSLRFRDRHSLLLQGELRWIPNRYGLDMAIFYDAGTVAPEPSRLSLSDLETSVGVGLRLHSPTATPVRIELARGSEGLRLVVAGSAAF
jgi:outer membrane protein assembly factor BamA